jgi:hypothetical protein
MDRMNLRKNTMIILNLRKNKEAKHKWLRGTILDPVIAIMVLVSVFTMAFTILTRLNIYPGLRIINKAHEMISSEVYETLNDKQLINKEITEGSLTLNKTITQIPESNLIKVELMVTDADNKLLARRILIYPSRRFYL